MKENNHKRAMAEGKAVAKRATGTEVAVDYDYSAHAGAGFEDMGREDFAVPFLYVLQANSKILLKRDDLKAGMLFNTVSEVGFPADQDKNQPGALFIPVHRQHVYVEWRPRDAGGGFVGQFNPEDEVVQKCITTQPFGEFKTPAGNDLIETFYLYGIQVLNEEEGQVMPVCNAFTSTKIKIYKNWMTRADSLRITQPGGRKIKPPLFAHTYRLQTSGEVKDGQHFYNIRAGFGNGDAAASRVDPQGPLFLAALDLHELAREGGLRAATESLPTGDSSGGGREPGDEGGQDIREVF